MNMLTRSLGYFKGRPAVLASLAGQPAGINTKTTPRRGTVLVLILGALALISVVTLVYVILGRGDSRNTAVVVEKSQVDAAVEGTKGYIADIIARSALAVFADGYLDPSNPVIGGAANLVHKQWDYPYTDPYRISVLSTNILDQYRRFDPTGSYTEMTPDFAGTELRRPYQPWLASTFPTDLLPVAPANPRAFDTNKDWLQISNFAPDGRFVNLGNLAFRDPNNPQLGKRIGNFDALSALGGAASWNPRPPSVNANTPFSEMSYGLTLNNPANGQPYLVGARQLLAAPNTANAVPNTPAHWNMWQRGAFKLAGVDPYHSPGELGYLPYQWCDTDGDGFYDARWIELVDASNPNSPLSLLPRDDRYRWFAAIRAIDLSSLVNVNTATDLRRPARERGSTQGSPLGLYPEVDLLRLLRMDDIYAIYGFGYDALYQPTGGQTPYSYATDDFSTYVIGPARNVGEAGYNAIRLALLPKSAAIAERGALLQTTATGDLAGLTADQRALYFQQVGGQSNAEYYRAGTANSLRFSGRFGAADLQELFTRRTINDPGTLSRLEQAAGGRGPTLATLYLDVLRTVRTLPIDGKNEFTNAQGQTNGTPDPAAWARLIADVRQYLTPFSGARPLQSKPVSLANAGTLTTADLATDAYEAVRKSANPSNPTVTTGRDATMLFKAYADALLPGSDRIANHGYWSAPAYPILRTTAFGYNPELALRTAGFLTANFTDLYDGSTGIAEVPNAYTLLIDGNNYTGTIDNNRISFPWWTPRNPAANPPPRPGTLDLGDARLPGNGPAVPLTTHAINIYGIEAQPFITQVVSFCIYTDAPSAAGGDQEVSGIPNQLIPITIEGHPVAPNPPSRDVLGQVLVFQLTNPFDVTIPLSDRNIVTNFQSVTDTQMPEFYIEFAGAFYKLVNDAAAGPQSLVLKPGETRNFYVLSGRTEDLKDRWDSMVSDPAITVSVQDFLESQLSLPQTPGVAYTATELTTAGARVKPIAIRRMDPTNGTSIPHVAGAFRDLLEPIGGAGTNSLKNVYLWRNLDTVGTGTGRPDRTKHMLADRLRDPGDPLNATRPTLDRRRRSTASSDIDNTLAGTEWWPTVGTPPGDDNTGYTIALWGSVRRRDDANGGTSLTDPRPVIGGLPAYCLESKWPAGSPNLRNISETDRLRPDNLDKTDFNGDNADTTMPGFLAKCATVSGTATTPGMYGGVILKKYNSTTATITARADQRSGDKLRDNLDTKPYSELYPQIALQNKQFLDTLATTPPVTVSTLRVTDMLLPLGIGPCQDPGLAPPTTVLPGQTFNPDTAMTLGEALAVALNYANPPATGDPFSIYYRTGAHPTAPVAGDPPSVGAFDRGNLSLDKFVPFLDGNNNGIPNPGERVVFPGVPIALNVLSAFRTLDPQFGGLTKATPGLININTADLRVLRLLPLLSPTTDTGSLAPPGGQAYSRFNVDSSVVVNDGHLPAQAADIANGLFAYCHKVASWARNNTTLDTFEDTVLDPFGTLLPPGGAGDGRARSTSSTGAAGTTGVPGTREDPGFVIPGEILNATVRGLLTANTARVSAADRIDALALDAPAIASGTAGTASVLFPIPGATTPTVPDNIRNDYTEKLLVASGVMNSITVRSDVFAVWFVLHGYQRTDTENLGPNDPLVPSVAKRFLMVVDRSNVTRLGEKPKILLFTELPM